MFQSKKTLLCGVIASMLMWSVLPAHAESGSKDSLANYIPEDVWLYSRCWRSPSRDFLEVHWRRIFKSLKNCGIDQEIRKAIFATLPDHKKTEFDKKWNDITAAIGAVAWGDLICEEFAFAERFESVVPDIILLARPKRETLEQNVKGLAGIFDLFNTYAVGHPVAPKKKGNMRIWSIQSNDGAVGLHFLHMDDKIALVFGHGALSDVQSLLLGETRIKNILNNAKFQRAIKEVPKPGHAITFLDMDRLFDWFAKLPTLVLGQRDQIRSFGTVHRVLAAVTMHLDFLDYVIVSQETIGRSQFEHSVVRLKNDCCQKPLAKALSHQEPISNFTRFIPMESKAYGVSTMFDLRAIHDTVLDVIRNEVPDGAKHCQKFEEIQRSMEFNLREDLLDWIGGEIVFSAFPPIIPSPFAQEDAVFLLRIRDVELARSKFPVLVKRGIDFAKGLGQPLSVSPASTLPVEGFNNLTIPTMMMFVGTPCFGIWDDWLVLGTSEDAVALVMKTAAGKHPSITENDRAKREALLTDDPVVAASFADLSNIGQELSAAFFGAGFAAGMMPNDRDVAPIKAVFNSLIRLGPVMNQIDFLSSTSSITTFKDNAWHTKTVTTYKPAAETEPK